MANSMTGFGRATASNEAFQMTVEIKSINHRYQEVYVRAPRTLSFLEPVVRRYMKEHGERGKYDISLEYQALEESTVTVSADLALAQEYLKAIDTLKTSLQFDEDVNLAFVARLPEVLVSRQKELDEKNMEMLLLRAIEQAMQALWSMRSIEGKALTDELLKRTNHLEEMTKQVQRLSENAPKEVFAKMEERIKALLSEETRLDEERLENEIAYLADKMNIEEELNRLYSHIGQFRETVVKNQPVGRTLDFIVQEMNRETNTVGSKVSHQDIATLVIEMKTEIEKMREQIQNLV